MLNRFGCLYTCSYRCLLPYQPANLPHWWCYDLNNPAECIQTNFTIRLLGLNDSIPLLKHCLWGNKRISCPTHSVWSRGRGSSLWACLFLSCTCRAPLRKPAPPLGSPLMFPPLSSPPSRASPPFPSPCPSPSPSPRRRTSCWGRWPCVWLPGLFFRWVPFYSWVWPAKRERKESADVTSDENWPVNRALFKWCQTVWMKCV